MATGGNNLRVPDDLLSQAQRMARTQGRTADERAADALERYLAHEWLNRLEREGQERRQSEALTSEEDVAQLVERAISEHRREQRGR